MTDNDTNADPRAWAASLAGRIDELGSLLARLDELGRAQRELIEDERTDALLGVLAERSQIVQRVVETSEQMDALRRRWDEMSGRIDEPERERLRVGLDDLTEVARRITVRDDQDREMLQQRRDELARRLSGVGTSRAAMGAYAGSGRSPKGPSFQDREA